MKAIEYQDAIDVEADDATQVHGDNSAIEDKINQEFAADSDDVKWKIVVSKKDEKSAEFEHCFYCTPEDFPLADRLYAEFGHGTFKVLVYRNGKIHRNLRYRIAARKEQSPAPQSQISDIAALVRQNNEQVAAMLAGRAPTAQSVDPMTQFAQMMGLMVQMKEFFAAPAREGGLDTFLKALEVAKEFSGENSGRNAMDVVAEILRSPVIEHLAENLPKQRQISSAPTKQLLPAPKLNPISFEVTPTPPRETVQPNNFQTPIQNPGFDEQTFEILQIQLKKWGECAERGSDPELYAELALDEFGDDFAIWLASQDRLKDMATMIFPPIEKSWEWVEELRAAIFRLTEDADSEDKGDGTEMGGVDTIGQEGARPTVEAPSSDVPSRKSPHTDDTITATAVDGNTGRPGGDRRDVKAHGALSKGRAKTSGNKTTGVAADTGPKPKG